MITSPIRLILITCIKMYRIFISPILPNCCIYHPSCSAYCIEALNKHGVFYGCFLSIKRILRCNAFFAGGTDLVPSKERKEKNSNKCK